MGDYVFRFQKLSKTRMSRLVLVMGMIATVVLVICTLTLPARKDLSSTLLEERSLPSDPESIGVGKPSILRDSQNSTDSAIDLKEVDTARVFDEIDRGFRIKEIDGDMDSDDDSDGDIDRNGDGDPNRELPFDVEGGALSKTVGDRVSGLSIERVMYPKKVASLKTVGVVANESTPPSGGVRKSFSDLALEQIKILDSESSSSITPSGKETTDTVAPSGKQAKETLLKNEALLPLQSGSATSNVSPIGASMVRKKKRVMPPVYMSEMNHLLLRNLASYHSMRPRWSSGCDKQILAVKAQIEKAPVVKNEQDLYAPLFRNISKFKRSYELMERMLKVYVYKEGQKPIFHQPLLKGIYASEGWFMKLMETDRRFIARDPRKAHLFYLPFSSRYLQFALYVPNSHNRRNLELYLKNYMDMIATKYPFWNRTGGADHFLVACHDWAPFETRHTMGRSIRALCNADLRNGFRLGKDVSLPETYVRSARNPLKDLGGSPAGTRPILAFYAGNMHGSLRPILVQHWENKDPDMKIFGPMPAGVRSKMTYIQHMKNSKYCVCPRGYEVNSPRVVESIFYECVPVIISDSYVPPFFEVLNWEAFSVILPEKDVPRLKEILESIPEEKYQALQKGVRKAQRHFLWHSKPVKYDLFHMILHSIWFNRVYQIRPR